MPGSAGLPCGVFTLCEAAEFVASRFTLPWDEACAAVREGLQCGEVSAVLVGSITSQGRRAATVADLGDEALDFGPDPAVPDAPIAPSIVLTEETDEPHSWSLGTIRILRPEIEVNHLALERYVEAIFGRAPASAALPRDRGGRPAKHDWTLAAIQATARVYEHGLPLTKNELSRELAAWFAERFGDAPDMRQIERFVAKIWPELRKGPDAICQLRPAGGKT